MSLDRLAYKIECVSALAGTGCQYSPYAFAPKPAVFAASALCNIAVYHNKPYRLLSEIIGRLNARRCDKSEISIAMCAKAIRQILSLTTFRNIVQRNTKESFSARFHRFCKTAFCQFFGFVKNAEHITHRIKQFLAVIGGGPISKASQIFKFSNEMSDAKLYQNIEVFHIFAIGREVVATNDPCEVFTKNINQHPRAACIGNFEQSISIPAKTPCPETLFVFLMAGFINIKFCFIGQIFKKLIICLFKTRERWLHLQHHAETYE